MQQQLEVAAAQLQQKTALLEGMQTEMEGMKGAMSQKDGDIAGGQSLRMRWGGTRRAMPCSAVLSCRFGRHQPSLARFMQS